MDGMCFLEQTLRKAAHDPWIGRTDTISGARKAGFLGAWEPKQTFSGCSNMATEIHISIGFLRSGRSILFSAWDWSFSLVAEVAGRAPDSPFRRCLLVE